MCSENSDLFNLPVCPVCGYDNDCPACIGHFDNDESWDDIADNDDFPDDDDCDD